MGVANMPYDQAYKLGLTLSNLSGAISGMEMQPFDQILKLAQTKNLLEDKDQRGMVISKDAPGAKGATQKHLFLIDPITGETIRDLGPDTQREPGGTSGNRLTTTDATKYVTMEYVNAAIRNLAEARGVDLNTAAQYLNSIARDEFGVYRLESIWPYLTPQQQESAGDAIAEYMQLGKDEAGTHFSGRIKESFKDLPQEDLDKVDEALIVDPEKRGKKPKGKTNWKAIGGAIQNAINKMTIGGDVGNAPDIPKIQTQREFDKLPEGTSFIGYDGKRYKKVNGKPESEE